jgi:hypothetical protein
MIPTWMWVCEARVTTCFTKSSMACNCGVDGWLQDAWLEGAHVDESCDRDGSQLRCQS